MKKLIRITTVPVSLRVLLKDQLKFVSSYYKVIAVSSHGKDLQRVKEEQQVEVKAVDMTRKITPLKDLIALWRLYTLFKKEAPLIVHTHTPKAGTLGMIASKLAGVPIRIHTVAGLPLLEERGVKRKVLNMVEKVTYVCANKVYPNSFKLKEIIEKERFCNSAKLKVIGMGSSNGIDTHYFNSGWFSDETKSAVKNTLHILPEELVFCFVGRLVKDKGINELVAAFQELSQSYIKIKLLLVGPFEQELDPLEAYTKECMEQNAQIISVGYQKDVRPYLAISDVFVFPSYREGFPNVVMQAGAMSVPAIVTDINGCNEIITHEENGLIISSKNKEALKKSMERLLLDTALRHKLASQCRDIIIKQFEQQYVWSELLKEYKTLETSLHN